MGGFEWKTEIGVFAAMAFRELFNVTVDTLYKAANSNGLNYFVFIAYTYIIGTLVLLPLPFIFPRKRGLPPFKLSLLYKIAFSSLLGASSNAFIFKGVEYSSPALSSIIGNISPALIFVLAVIFRMESLDLGKKTTRMKIFGTVLSISGSVVAILYKGSTILEPTSSPSSSKLTSSSLSSETSWLLGGSLLILGKVLGSFWYIVQTKVVTEYPDERTVTAIYFVFKTLISLPVCVLEVSDLSDWALRPNLALIAVVSSGLFGTACYTFITTWVLHLKGPLYAAIFSPFSIAIAAIFGVIFLGDGLFLGSVVGAVLVLLGLYSVLLGKAQEKASGSDPPHERTPLLQNKMLPT